MRINLGDPKELFDQHLQAEYRELFITPYSLPRILNQKNGFDLKRIPKKFTLNKGHILFFVDKGEYLRKRYDLVCAEMKRRNRNIDESRVFPIDMFPAHLRKDWTPEPGDYNIIYERIKEKVKQKPNFYKYEGKPIKELDQFKKYFV